MKNKISVLLCSILLLLAVVFPISQGVKLAEAYKQDNTAKIVSSMKAYKETGNNKRLYNLTKSHINKNMDKNLTIEKTKTLFDFDGNEYYLFELEPTGYIIFHIDSGKFVEYSTESISPYKNYNSDLFYGGVMQYYYKSEETLYHTLKKNNEISASEIPTLAISSREIYDGLMQYTQDINLDYIYGKENNNNLDFLNIESGTENVRAMAVTPRISMTSFFPPLNLENEMGYNEHNVCGYIAGNLIIGYNYFAYDYGLIYNSSYVNRTNKTMNGPGLTNRLIVLNGQNPNSHSIPGTDASDLFDVIPLYLNEVYEQRTWSYFYRNVAIDVKPTLDAGYPVALFGSLKKPGTNTLIFHAVVAYDYANYGLFNMFRKYRVHFGWPNRSSVWLESPLIGTNFFMKIGSI